MARGATEASSCAMSLAESCRSFSRVARSCFCSSCKRVDSPAVRRWRVLEDKLSRLEVTSLPACASSPESFWLSAPRRLSKSASRAVTVLRVRATATSTCTKRAIPRVTNTGRNRRLCNNERTADIVNPSTWGAIKLIAPRKRETQQGSCRIANRNDKGPPKGPFVFYINSLLRERMTQNDGLVAVRARRNNVDRRTDQLFNALDVSTGVGW